MNDNKGQKIDINGSIADSISGVIITGIGMSVIAFIACCLFGPFLAPLFQNGVERRNKDDNGFINYDVVRMKMKLIFLALCLLSIVSWTYTLKLAYDHKKLPGQGYSREDYNREYHENNPGYEQK